MFLTTAPRPWPTPRFLAGFLGLAIFAALVVRGIPDAASLQHHVLRTRAADRPRLAAALASLPLRFEEHRGQFTGPSSEVMLVARGEGFSASFTPNGVLLALGSGPEQMAPFGMPCRTLRCMEEKRAALDAAAHSISPQDQSRPPRLLNIRWEGEHSAAGMRGARPLAGRANYLTGDDPRGWQRDIRIYERVEYQQIYPGVDLDFYGRQREMEFDLTVFPGASAGDIKLVIEGADDLEVTAQGALEIRAGDATLLWKPPVIYQERAGQRVEIAGGYQLHRGHRVGFRVGEYDTERPLVIDPVLAHSSYLGGLGSDQIQGVALDAQGNIYVAGVTAATNFPTASAFRATKSAGTDMFITKLDPTGTRLVYSTYLGGNGDDAALRLAVSSDGSVTVAGYTGSTNFPTAAPAQAANAGGVDGVVARLNAAGSALLFSTYLGGGAEDAALAVAVDASGAAYVTGYTRSANFPLLNPFRASSSGTSEAFVTKLSSAGARVYSTYLGGSAGDIALGIAADDAGNAVVAGTTTSTNYPTLSPFQAAFAGGTCSGAGTTFPCGDVFVTRFAPAGSSVTFSTYLGGTGDDQANGVALALNGEIYLTGYTTSTNFPTRTPLQPTLAGLSDVFVTKMAANGSALVYSTYLGGAVTDAGTAVAVDGGGSAYVTGLTESSTFPTVNPLDALGLLDAFVTKLTPAGNGLAYSTFLGGGDFDQGLAIAVDATGNAFVAGWTSSDDFPMRSPVQSAFGGGICGTPPLQYICEDGFLARISFVQSLFTGGMVNGASFAPGAPVAAGSIVSAFGSDLASGIAGASALPLPTTLVDLSVRMNNTLAPLFFVAGSQINLQVPWEMAGQSQATISVTTTGTALPPITVALTAAAPGIFTINAQGTGQGAILVGPAADLAAPAGSVPGRSSRPANRNETIVIFCTGLGPVSNRPASGAAAPSGPLAVTTTLPVVTIGGTPATVNFSGLAPGFVGLYQVNAVVPANSATGSAIPVVISLGGAVSNTVTIAVQ